MEQIQAAGPVRLYVHSDGSRAQVPTDAERVAAVRQMIPEILGAGTPVITLFRSENRGLRKGVFDALNWFFEQEEYGIVLEDDCVPDPSLFPFCEELLLRYKDNPQIMHIGCSNLAEDLTQNKSDSYVFSRFSFVWGWASWRRAWQHIKIDLEGLEQFKLEQQIRQLVPDEQAQAYMLDKFEGTAAGKNNSWAYAWFYSILKNKGLCIVPKTNLVQNRGVGEAGATHTTSRNRLAEKPARAMSFPLLHPADVEVDPALEQHFFYTSQKRRLRLRLWSVLRWLGLR
ncbi:MAG: nucleotide-diphospho-sugar transferase [Saprospiraceae bacterium]|nr:nucleotide-diphospho-sugar transferase [Saprospiraceae bacterium]